MKSQVVILLVGIVLLKVSVALAEGEEATTVPAGAEASPLNSNTTADSSASVPPPSPKEADDGAAKKTDIENPCKETDERNSKAQVPDPNYKCTETYTEETDKRLDTETPGKCIKIYHKDKADTAESEQSEALKKANACVANCPISVDAACMKNCYNDYYRSITYKCGLSGGAIAGIIIAVLILLAVAGAGLFFYLKKKRGVANGPQPPAAPPAPANPPPVVSKSNSHV